MRRNGRRRVEALRPCIFEMPASGRPETIKHSRLRMSALTIYAGLDFRFHGSVYFASLKEEVNRKLSVEDHVRFRLNKKKKKAGRVRWPETILEYREISVCSNLFLLYFCSLLSPRHHLNPKKTMNSGSTECWTSLFFFLFQD